MSTEDLICCNTHYLPMNETFRKRKSGHKHVWTARLIWCGTEYSQYCRMLETSLSPRASQAKLVNKEKNSPAHCIQQPCCFYASGVRFWQAIALFSKLQLNLCLGRDHFWTAELAFLIFSFTVFPTTRTPKSNTRSEHSQTQLAADPEVKKHPRLFAWRTGNPQHKRDTGRARWQRSLVSTTSGSKKAVHGLFHRCCKGD